MALSEPKGAIKTIDGNVQLFKADLSDNVGQVNTPVSVRSAPIADRDTFELEESYFQRARNAGKGVLLALRHFDKDDRRLFVYEDYDVDLEEFSEEFAKPLLAADGCLPPQFLLALRKTLHLLHILHWERKVAHDNLTGPKRKDVNIVIVKNQKKPGDFIVKLRCFAKKQEKEKEGIISDRQELGFILERLIEFPHPHGRPLWLGSILKSLRCEGSIRNLYNSLCFLSATERFEYLVKADRAVENGGLRPKLSKAFSKDQGALSWMHKVRADVFLQRVLDHHKIRNTAGLSNASAFLHYCKNVALHYLELDANDQVVQSYDEDIYKKLALTWPKFFDLLHEVLCQEDVFIFE
ncbi:unnamed protein product [Linum trigynum]|uniref:Protein kinase domain-containing protein n=1 Tax=Linum trigynum TaxID=586398 RepID=A0AAV2DVV9_9ROSI